MKTLRGLVVVVVLDMIFFATDRWRYAQLACKTPKEEEQDNGMK